jgi:hypothetical protein
MTILSASLARGRCSAFGGLQPFGALIALLLLHAPLPSTDVAAVAE